MIKGAMAFRSVDGSDYRVSVERLSVSEEMAYVRFTRNSQYLPWSLEDNSMWVMVGQLHAIKAAPRITKTSTGRKAEMSDGTSVELVSKPRRKRNPVSTEPTFSDAESF